MPGFGFSQFGTGTAGTLGSYVATQDLDMNGHQIINSKGFDLVIVVDGITYPQNSTGINAALVACNAAGGGKVFMPAGTYDITTVINVPANIHLMGAGYATILKSNVTFITSYGIKINGNDVILSDFKFDDNVTLVGAGRLNSIYANGRDNIIFRNLWVYDGTNPITTRASSSCLITGCKIQIFTGEGIYVSTTSTGTKIIGNEVTESRTGTANGIFLKGYGIIANNYSHNNLASGINLELGSHQLVIGNYCINNAVEGINIITCTESNIVGNYVETNGQGGMKIQGSCSKVNIIGNYFMNNTGIQFGSTTNNGETITDINVNENYFEGGTTYGIQFGVGAAVSTMERINICNNYFSNIAYNAIEMYDKIKDFKIDGNMIYNSGYRGIFINYVGYASIGQGVITNNYIHTTLSTTRASIEIDQSSNLIINNNFCYLGGFHGISLTNGSTNITINGNFCLNNGVLAAGNGINIGSTSTDVVISGNRAYDTAGAGGTQTYGINYVVGCDYLNAVGNNWRGNKTGSQTGTIGANSIDQHNIV